MSLQIQQAWRTGGRASEGRVGGSLGFVDSPRPPPPPPWTKPPQLRAWPSNLAGSLGPLCSLSFGALRTAAATCPHSKVTFVRRNRLLRGLEELLLDGGCRCGKYVGGPTGRVSVGQTVARQSGWLDTGMHRLLYGLSTWEHAPRFDAFPCEDKTAQQS